MFKPITLFSAVVAMAAFVAAMPAPDIPFTNPQEKPIGDGLSFVGATGNAIGTAAGHTAVAAEKTGKFFHDVKEDAKDKFHRAGEKASDFVDESKETAKKAAQKTGEFIDESKETAKKALKATAEALSTGTKFVVGTIAWGATGLYNAGEKGVHAIGDFGSAAKDRVVVILRPVSPSNIKKKASEGVAYVKSGVDTLTNTFTCNVEKAFKLVYRPHTKQIYCENDNGQREEPIKRSDADKEADKDTEYEVSAYEESQQ
ncbi:hypothetical protein BDF22DRAFT_773905 [Syncephalis plumigaleata]|nr:hypothetical protein BDF22DRAFT_773905 [Syncephalis plumigaleata]